MNENDKNPSSECRPEVNGQADAIFGLLKPQLDQLVIVVPDSMEIDPIEERWIFQNNPYYCRIILLGKCKAHKKFEIGETLYREVLLKLIAAGVKAIHKESLEQTNAEFLEAHPDAEGIPLWQPKSQK